jgi:hypothetical protein
MADPVSVWYDSEGDFLEVVLEVAEGVYQETDDDRVMEKVGEDGRLLAFSILGLRSIPPSVFLDIELRGGIREPAASGAADA